MVHIQTGTIENFIEKCVGKRVACFGAGKHFDYILRQFVTEKLYRYIDVVVDNKEELWGKTRKFEEKEYPVISFEMLCRYAEHNELLIVITNHFNFNEIIEQMDQETVLDGVEAFLSDLFVRPIEKYPTFEIQAGKASKIPKIIHYCWFGSGELSPEYLTYMETWKKYCPDYEIKLWNENNYDITKNQYMRQAYEKRMWAFVSDYARVDIVYKYGGIYLDCDVELLKPLDELLGTDMYCGFENCNCISLGLGFGAIPGHPYLKALLNYYEQLKFVGDDEKINLTPCPAYQTEVITQFGIVPENKFQQTNNITVYPTEVFSPYSYWGIGKVTDKTYSIHHYSGSWVEADDKLKFEQWKVQLKKFYERIEAQWENEKNGYEHYNSNI